MEDDRERDPHIDTLYGQDSGQAELDGTPYSEEIARQSISISQFRSAPLPTPQISMFGAEDVAILEDFPTDAGVVARKRFVALGVLSA